MSWRSLSPGEIDKCWMRISGEIEDEVLENINWRTAKETRALRVQNGSKKQEIRASKNVKIAGQEFSLGSESLSCSESKA